jgi:methionyl-tRNA formyltransferase
MPATAVVFAYHDVGVRCLSVLLDQGVEVKLVVTHRDDPKERVFFANVERLARKCGLEVTYDDDPGLEARVRAIAPDFIFSFYYRRMLAPALLANARRGAFNMHGSLLPQFRGRAPVNWAVLKGARETGATLHEMVAKPDAGRIVGQLAVPIGEDDLAVEVFERVTDAAERLLADELPKLLAGTAKLTPQDLARGSYFGGRRPEDGRIDAGQGTRAIHNLVRAVAPPYPGAFLDFRGGTLKVLRTRVSREAQGSAAAALRAGTDGRLFLECADGGELEILALEWGGESLTPRAFCDNIGPGTHRLES